MCNIRYSHFSDITTAVVGIGIDIGDGWRAREAVGTCPPKSGKNIFRAIIM